MYVGEYNLMSIPGQAPNIAPWPYPERKDQASRRMYVGDMLFRQRWITVCMSQDNVKRAAEMLLGGATLLAQPCPYCSGVRVMKDGRALCVSCGSEPEKTIPQEPGPGIEQQVLDLTKQLGSAADPAVRQKIIDEITRLSGQLAAKQG